MARRVPVDLAAYVERVHAGPCFVCRIVDGFEDVRQHVVYDDGRHIAFLPNFHVLLGYVLVAPRDHREAVVADFTAEEYLELQEVVRRVGRALAASISGTENLNSLRSACALPSRARRDPGSGASGRRRCGTRDLAVERAAPLTPSRLWTSLPRKTGSGSWPRGSVAGVVSARRHTSRGGTDIDSRGFLAPLIGDGRPLLLAMTGGLLFGGAFAVFLAATGEFLPHDIHYLGMSAEDLDQVADGQLVDFMVHDRSAFGGTVFAIGVLYLWLIAFPLSNGERWAWWTLLISGTVGFLGFLAYLGYGYLDSWHGIGTLLMAPLFIGGLARTRVLLTEPSDWRCLLRPGDWSARPGRMQRGRIVLLLGAVAVTGGGLAILRVGIGDTFVPEDLEFLGLTAAQLDGINPRLVPLLAHDRAGFGSGVLTLGLTTALCLWNGDMRRHLHQAVLIAGVTSLAGALGVHFAVGYTDLWHLTPALVAACSLIVGCALQHPGQLDDPMSTSAGAH